MTDTAILFATLSWWLMLLGWPIAIAVAAILWGVNAYIEFRRHSHLKAAGNLLGIAVMAFVGILVMQSWDVIFIAWLPSSLRPLFQIFTILLPWFAIVFASAILFRRKSKPSLDVMSAHI